MLKKMRNHIKNQRGLTLIELLAVVVILGIISAIAVPSIGGLIDNTKKDAHVANAQQMINAAKIHVTSQPDDIGDLSLEDMIEEGLIESFDDPDGGNYNVETSSVTVNKAGNAYTYTVTLIGSERSVTGVEGAIDRDDVTENTP